MAKPPKQPHQIKYVAKPASARPARPKAVPQDSTEATPEAKKPFSWPPTDTAKPARPARPHSSGPPKAKPPYGSKPAYAAKPSKKPAPPKTAKIAEPIIEAEEPELLTTFADLELSEPIKRAITELGFEAPTPIQARSIPLLLAGRDLIGQAQTGTGKTAAFALPLIQMCDASRTDTQVLILEPTRELAVQVAGGILALAKHTGLRVVPVYGGQPLDRQFRALREGAHIVVGTPGRIMDHLRRGTLAVESVRFCVLDEADEMLALGFLEDMETILAQLPEQRQLAFFSATMPPRIAALTQRFLKNPAHIAIDAKRRTVETTNQTYYEVAPGRKLEALARVLDMETPGPTIIFCRTRQETNDLADALRLRGYSAEALHGDLGQADRDRVMRRFREGLADLLIATDVAARGLDIETVTHVINYDIPWDVEQYIHRIGRTGRAGRSGDAITLVEGRERRQLRAIEQMIGATIKPARIPTAADIAARRRDLFQDSLRETLAAGAFDGHLATVEALSEEFDTTEIAAAALQMLWQSQHSGPAEAAEELNADSEQPEVGMTRLFVGLGRQDGLRPGDLVGAISNEAGLPGKAIGAIDILDRTAFVEVPSPEARNIVAALRNATIRGRKVKIEVAQPAEGRRRG
jgi:ATP-dependent RNA helicase DeaD